MLQGRYAVLSPGFISPVYFHVLTLIPHHHLQSYAGKYVPAISYYIHKNNPTAKVKINLVGMAIGDGLCDPEMVCAQPDCFCLNTAPQFYTSRYKATVRFRCWAVTATSCTRQG